MNPIKLNKDDMISSFNLNRNTPDKYQVYQLGELPYKEIANVVDLYEQHSIFNVQFWDLVPPDFEDRVVVCGEYVLNSILYNTQYFQPECDIELVYLFNKDVFNKFNLYINYLFTKFKITNTFVFRDWLIFKTESGFYIKIIIYLCHTDKLDEILRYYGNQSFNALLYYQKEYYGIQKSDACIKQAMIRVPLPESNGSNFEYHVRKCLHKGFNIIFNHSMENLVCKLATKYDSGYGFILSPTTNIYEFEQAFRAKYKEISKEYLYSKALAWIANIHCVTVCGYDDNFWYNYPIFINLINKHRVVKCFSKDEFINNRGFKFTNLTLYCIDHMILIDNGFIHIKFHLVSDEFIATDVYKLGKSVLPRNKYILLPEFYINPPKIELYMYPEIVNKITSTYKNKIGEKILML